MLVIIGPYSVISLIEYSVRWVIFYLVVGQSNEQRVVMVLFRLFFDCIEMTSRYLLRLRSISLDIDFLWLFSLNCTYAHSIDTTYRYDIYL